MSRLNIEINDPSRLPAAARELLDFAGDAKVMLFSGEMGVGKTTFIKALCRALGSEDQFSSPTFAIVNEYDSPGGKIFHFDLYRLKNAGELLDIGIDEYLNSGSYCFFEWPDLVQDMVQPPYVRIEMSVEGERRALHAERR